MNVIERLKALSAAAVFPNEPYIVIPKRELDMLLAFVRAYDHWEENITSIHEDVVETAVAILQSARHQLSEGDHKTD